MIDHFIMPLPLQSFKLWKLAELDMTKNVLKLLFLIGLLT